MGADHSVVRLEPAPATTSTRIYRTAAATADRPDSHDRGWPAPHAAGPADQSLSEDRSPRFDCAGALAARGASAFFWLRESDNDAS